MRVQARVVWDKRPGILIPVTSTIASTTGSSEGQSGISYESRYRCKDGSYRWLLWSTVLHTERNSWYATGHDITDRKQAQSALEQRNQDLDSFVHIVSHDLKAPLRAVSNLSEWIEEDFQRTLSAHSQQQMALLRSRVQGMEAKIGGLLDYARTRKMDVSIEPVVLSQLLAEVITSIAPLPTFTIEVAANLPTFPLVRVPARFGSSDPRTGHNFLLYLGDLTSCLGSVINISVS